ncbi:carbohydrate ABC transporter permease [Kineococcus rhizosphaerae]|uniref:Carbohydrate ABC transporter membrane protein 2 (CUT1 family) n=1 Tax=Kineococcus rhizosphaerae TaxID=559628 RepID=A0A2T0QZB5_9ACTN|nr:carbohydrate ABC transporter permease [Kineococcus rhizosphaerae]PRY11865.1 carbohydrate ABC transporter membrane protein 2 (CUT1 family) [Kineococcus rhizosphaerae]
MTTETTSTRSTAPLAVTSRRPVGPRTWVTTAAANVVTAVLGVMFLIPLLWVVFAAFNAKAGLKLEWPGSGFSLDNFRAVLTPETTYRPMWNGLVLCVGSTVIAIFVATLAAYPLSRFETRYKRPFLLTILFSTGLPITAIMVPVYGLFVQLNLIDTIGGTIAFMATTALPMSIFLCKNFMDGVPLTLEEAAWTDGANSMQTLRHIVLPLMWPGLSVVTIFTFIGMWGNFFIPFVLLLSPDRLPASVSIFTFFGQYGSVQWGQLAAYSVLYTLPVVVLYVLLSRRLGGAFNFGGALKG